MRTFLLVSFVLAFGAKVRAQLEWIDQPYLEVLERWSDSLEIGYCASRLWYYNGSPTSITLQELRVGRSGLADFDPAQPFSDLEETLGTTTRFLMDGRGRFVSRTEWERWSPEEPTDHDTLVYGPHGLVKWTRGATLPVVTSISWIDGRPSLAEKSENGFVQDRTVWTYDDMRHMVLGERTAMYRSDTTRWRIQLGENGVMEQNETFEGKDSSVMVYHYFPDSSCIWGWTSIDTARSGQGDLHFISGISRHQLSGGNVRETSYGEGMSITGTDEFENGMRVRSVGGWDREYTYDQHGGITKVLSHFPPVEGYALQRPNETRYYYLRDEKLNPTAILMVDFSGIGGAEPFGRPEMLWRLRYRYR